MTTLELTENTIRRNIAYFIVDIILRRQLLKNHLTVNSAMMKSKKVLTWRNTLFWQVKIDNNIYSAKVNVTDSTKDNFTQLPSIKEILDESKMYNVDHYRALLI